MAPGFEGRQELFAQRRVRATTMMAGASTPSFLAVSAASFNVVMSTRSSSLVACMTMATGVSSARATAHEGCGDFGKMRQRHVEHDGLTGGGELLPITRGLLIDGAVASCEDDGVVRLARGRRNACECRARKPGRQSGTTRNGMPSRTRAAASSPPRPKTNGSPPLRRTTLRRAWPRR